MSGGYTPRCHGCNRCADFSCLIKCADIMCERLICAECNEKWACQRLYNECGKRYCYTHRPILLAFVVDSVRGEKWIGCQTCFGIWESHREVSKQCLFCRDAYHNDYHFPVCSIDGRCAGLACAHGLFQWTCAVCDVSFPSCVLHHNQKRLCIGCCPTAEDMDV